MTDETPEWDERTFLQLGDLAGRANVSIATLATAIERHGIQGWDRYGRFTTFKAGDAEAVVGLEFLARQHEWNCNVDNCQDGTQSPVESWEGPGYGVGWLDDEAPDFDAIAAESKGRSLPEPPKKSGGNGKGENHDMRLIAALLEVIDGTALGTKHPDYQSTQKLAQELEKVYGSRIGTEGSLVKKFSAARQKLQDRIDNL